MRCRAIGDLVNHSVGDVGDSDKVRGNPAAELFFSLSQFHLKRSEISRQSSDRQTEASTPFPQDIANQVGGVVMLCCRDGDNYDMLFPQDSANQVGGSQVIYFR